MPHAAPLTERADPKLPAWLGRADGALGGLARTLLFATGRAGAWFYIRNIGLFALFTLAIYRIFPKFLMQNVDGVNLYFVVDKLNLWRSSPFEAATVTPLESMTSTLWFPLNFTFIPPFSSFVLSTDPTLRVYLMTVLAALVIFVSSLFFYVAMGFLRGFAVAAAWISFALIMLQDTNLYQGINNVQVMAWAYVCLALLAYVGKHYYRSWAGALPLILFQAAAFAYVLSDPVWHLTTLPVFGLVALAILIGAESALERWLKVASLGVALAIQAGLQTYVSLFYTLADTARSVLPREYGDVQRSASSAGYLFRGDTVAFTVGLLLILGLTVGHIDQFSARRRLARLVTIASVAFIVIVSAAGFVYLRYPQSPAFRTGYILEMGYPLAALFVVGAIWRLLRLARTATNGDSVWHVVGGWRSVGLALLALAVYVEWHLRTSPDESGALGSAVLALVSVVVLIRVGWERPAVGVAAVLLVVVLQAHIDAAYGSGSNPEFDGVKRIGLSGNAIVRHMAEETALRPGSVFRGYVLDVYRRTTDSPNVGDELVGHWLNNRDQYGNGQTLFAWGMFDIPTISEYDPFIRPLYYAFFTRLLNEPTDKQLDNYLGATRPNTRIMSLMGVRFIVTDRDDLNSLHQEMQLGKYLVLQTNNPNLGSYSPTQVTQVSSVREAVDQLRSDSFNPQTNVLVNPTADLPQLVTATPAELRFERGGYSVSASSQGWSLYVLPIQYSHCYAIAGAAAQDARLLRVNLVQTGLLVHGSVTLSIDFRHWPLASPECQRQDYSDAIQLDVSDLPR